MRKLAIIGYGTLGKILADILTRLPEQHYEICGIFARHENEDALCLNGQNIQVWNGISEVLESSADIVVEIAGAGAVKEYGCAILESGRDLVVTSAGALANDGLRECLTEAARQAGRNLYVTSGAIGGFDLLQTFALMDRLAKTDEAAERDGLQTEAEICSTKRPEGLNGAPCLSGRSLPADRPEEVFRGNAKEAIANFPKNVNVAVASGLASVGIADMKACVVSNPEICGNTHEITIENGLGRAMIQIQAKPDSQNPKSSVITAWSVAALLESLVSPIKFF